MKKNKNNQNKQSRYSKRGNLPASSKIATYLLTLLMVLILVFQVVSVQAAENFTSSDANILGDKLLSGTQVSHEGSVTGDLAIVGQNAAMMGYVGGDLLAMASDLAVSGEVDSNVRSISMNLTVSGDVNKNMSSVGGTITLTNTSHIKGNLYVAGESVSLKGIVDGKTWAAGSSIVLSGTFAGDVHVESAVNGKSDTSSLTVMPGTVIEGTLYYKGNMAPVIPSDATVGKVEFTEQTAHHSKNTMEASGWKVAIRIVLTSLLLFLLALLLLKLFPGFFEKPADFIQSGIMTTAGVGVAALGVFVGGGILLFIITIISVFLFQPIIFFILMSIPFSVLLVFGYFATLPVALYIGRLVSRRMVKVISIPGVLAIGIGILTVVKVALLLLAGLPGVGGVIAFFGGLLGFVVWILGTGANVRGMKVFFQAANKGIQPVEPIPVAYDHDTSDDHLFIE